MPFHGYSNTRRRKTFLIAFLPLIGLISASVSMAITLDNKWRCVSVPNPEMSYILQANSQFVTFGVPFTTNELGFRDGPIQPKVPGVFRIVCLGDSVTFGTGVANEQTFPNVLEAFLKQSASPGVTVDVVNAGISAYNVRNIRALLETYFQYLQPDVVVYSFVENDLDDSFSVDSQGRLVAYDPLKSHDELFVADDFPAMWMMRRDKEGAVGFWEKVGNLFANELNEVSETPPPLLFGDHAETARRWTAFEGELGRMKSLCANSNVPFLLYSFGLRNHSEPVVAKVRQVCQRLGIPETSTLPVFEQSTYMRQHSLGYDPHCNRLGHELMARRLYCFLLDQGVVPAQVLVGGASHNHFVETFDPNVSNLLEQKALAAPRLIDIETGKGALGLLGGIQVEGRMARSCLLRLGGPGDRIRVRVSAPLGTPEQPQMISAKIEGIPVSSPVVVPQSPVELSFPVPEQLRNRNVEVELSAHGAAWIPSLEERYDGSTPQTLKIYRVEREAG